MASDEVRLAEGSVGFSSWIKEIRVRYSRVDQKHWSHPKHDSIKHCNSLEEAEEYVERIIRQDVEGIEFNGEILPIANKLTKAPIIERRYITKWTDINE